MGEMLFFRGFLFLLFIQSILSTPRLRGQHGILSSMNESLITKVTTYTKGTIGIEWEIPLFRLHERVVIDRDAAQLFKRPSNLNKEKNFKLWTGARGGGMLQVELQGENQRGFEFVTPPITMDTTGRALYIKAVTDIALKATEIFLQVRNSMIADPMQYKYAVCAEKKWAEDIKLDKYIDGIEVPEKDVRTCPQLAGRYDKDNINSYIDCSHLRYPKLAKDTKGEWQYDENFKELCSFRPPWSGKKLKGSGSRSYAVVALDSEIYHWGGKKFWDLKPEEEMIGSFQISVAFDPELAGFALWDTIFFYSDYMQLNAYLMFTPQLKTSIHAVYDTETTGKPKSYWRRPGAVALIGWVSYFAYQFRRAEYTGGCNLPSIKDAVLGFNIRTNLTDFYEWVNDDKLDEQYDKVPSGEAWLKLIQKIAWEGCTTLRCGFHLGCDGASSVMLGGANTDARYSLEEVLLGIPANLHQLYDLDHSVSALPLKNKLTEENTLVIEFRHTGPICLTGATNEKNLRGTPTAANIVEMATRWYDVFTKFVNGDMKDNKDYDFTAGWKGTDNRCKSACYSVLKKESEKPKEWLVVPPQ